MRTPPGFEITVAKVPSQLEPHPKDVHMKQWSIGATAAVILAAAVWNIIFTHFSYGIGTGTQDADGASLWIRIAWSLTAALLLFWLGQSATRGVYKSWVTKPLALKANAVLRGRWFEVISCTVDADMLTLQICLDPTQHRYTTVRGISLELCSWGDGSHVFAESWWRAGGTPAPVTAAGESQYLAAQFPSSGWYTDTLIRYWVPNGKPTGCNLRLMPRLDTKPASA